MHPFNCTHKLFNVWLLCMCVDFDLKFDFLCRFETIFLTWRPLCSTKGNSARSTPMSMRWNTHMCSYLKWSTHSQSLSACCCSTCCFKGYQFKDAWLVMGRMKALPTVLCPFFLSVLPSILVTCLLKFYILICSGMNFWSWGMILRLRQLRWTK